MKNSRINEVGKVLNLFISKKRVEKFKVDEKGIIDSKHYNKSIDRSVLISSKKSYDIAISSGIEINHGDLGENIFIDYDLYHLKPGNQLQIGNTVLEISQNCTLCNSLTKIDSKLPKLLKDDRGIFAKVIVGGVISKNDTIHI